VTQPIANFTGGYFLPLTVLCTGKNYSKLDPEKLIKASSCQWQGLEFTSDKC